MSHCYFNKVKFATFPLYYLSFFDLRLLTTPLVSSNFSLKQPQIWP